MAARTRRGFTDVEETAMRDRARELRAEAKASKDRAAGEKAVLAKIAGMPEPDRRMARKFHAIVAANAPDLVPRTWYGMPAYANRAGKVVCFFQSGAKFKTRYSSFGFLDVANLDEGGMWPTGFALKELAADDEAKIARLVKRAVR